MILRDLWIGADFIIPYDDSGYIYCLIAYSPKANECVAIKIVDNSKYSKHNTAVSLPFDTEVEYAPRTGVNE